MQPDRPAEHLEQRKHDEQEGDLNSDRRAHLVRARHPHQRLDRDSAGATNLGRQPDRDHCEKCNDDERRHSGGHQNLAAHVGGGVPTHLEAEVKRSADSGRGDQRQPAAITHRRAELSST